LPASTGNWQPGTHSEANCSRGYVFASTFACACAILPFSSITYAMRRAYSSLAFSAAPYARPILWSVSHRSWKGKLNFFAKLAFSCCVSKLTPRTTTFFASY